MHRSLIKEYVKKYLIIPENPGCDIIDFHMHVCGGDEDKKYINIARKYGITAAGGMLHGTNSKTLIEKHGGFYFPIDWMKMPKKSSDKSWIGTEIHRIEKERERGLVAVKLRSTCKDGRPEVWIDHPYIIEVLKEVARMGIFIYIHIAEPSLWWPKYFDREIVGDKIDYFRPVENILKKCPGLKVVGAHMGGYPENLKFMDQKLEEYDDLTLDMSATKWMVRELGRNPDKSRDYIDKHSKRLYFGSDLVTFLSDGEDDYYHSRLSVLRHLFESEEVIPSMIIDPDAVAPDYPNGPEVRGLSLDDKILSRIYYENAMKMLKSENKTS